ncbi:MAG: NUDIX domain-containing protein [Pseudomonadaceae bacterium]|nr:NUDIX domain-containing protein [Pseudomonadaceae bacterium]
MADGLLDVVDENDVIVGQRLRSDIHREGLRHREVHVWFVTPEREVVFQRRSPTKDTFPNLLTSTAGGHVELGQTYLEAAIREVEEETGIHIRPEDLTELVKVAITTHDDVNGLYNKPFRVSYLYLFRGNPNNLRAEKGDGAGFALIPLAAIHPGFRPDIVPPLLEPLYQPMWQRIRELV